MEDFIWIVVNAGGNSREKEAADAFNASACRELTERRLIDQADILAEGPNNLALRGDKRGQATFGLLSSKNQLVPFFYPAS